MRRYEEILGYWLDEVGPKGWYAQDNALDDDIRDRFLGLWEEAMGGACGLWLTAPDSTLAYIILTDQFPRNMFRDSPRAFDSDKCARAAAKVAIGRDWDMTIAEPARQFFYMPLCHSESLIDQDRAVRLMCTRMPEQGAGNLLHARVHREIIRQFGRFPYRNAALGRAATEAEQEFLRTGGYGRILNEMRDDSAAA